MTTTAPIKNLFVLLEINCGEDLMNYCLSNPNEETVKSVHGEGLDTLYRKALGSMTAHMLNELRVGQMSRDEVETSAKYNLFLVGLARVDGCQTGIADLLKVADAVPDQVTELGFQLYVDSGVHMAALNAGVMDSDVSDEEASQRFQEELEQIMEDA